MRKEIRKELGQFADSLDRLNQNLDRVHRLVLLYKDYPGKGNTGAYKVDVLRAAVVFLHASLEDFLRSLAKNYLPQANEEILNLIPLKALSNSGRPEKFFLGKLTMHRGKSVDDLIEESVADYLERSNYNNSQEVALLLSNIGVDSSCVRACFSELDKMMKRRHQIVHRADRVDMKGKKKNTQSLHAAQVEQWIMTTRDFMGKVLVYLYAKEKNRLKSQA